MYSCRPLHMGEQRQDDQLEPIYSSSVPIQDVTLKTCWKQWTIGRGGERESQGYPYWWRDVMMMTWSERRKGKALEVFFFFFQWEVENDRNSLICLEGLQQIYRWCKEFSFSYEFGKRLLETHGSNWNIK